MIELAQPLVSKGAADRAAADDPGRWAPVIMEAWGRSVTAVIETGRLLAEAKAAVAHGDWERLCDEMLPFGSRTAQRLMQIAAHDRLSNPTHASLLPSSWVTLEALSRLDNETFDAAVEAGVITPTLERRRARRLAIGGLAAVADLPAPAPTRRAAALRSPEEDETDEERSLAYAETLLVSLFSIEVRAAPTLAPRARCFIVAAARAFGVAVDDLWKVDRLTPMDARIRAHVARRAAMYLLHTECEMAQPAASKVFGLEPSSVSRLSTAMEDWRSTAWDDLFGAVVAQAEFMDAFWGSR